MDLVLQRLQHHRQRRLRPIHQLQRLGLSPVRGHDLAVCARRRGPDLIQRQPHCDRDACRQAVQAVQGPQRLHDRLLLRRLQRNQLVQRRPQRVPRLPAQQPGPALQPDPAERRCGHGALHRLQRRLDHHGVHDEPEVDA